MSRTPVEIPAPTPEDVETQVWVVSDLQTADPDEARRCLGTAVEDATGAAGGFDCVWYLGDAIRGADRERNEQVAAVQVELLEGLDAPVRYVMGNHDLDEAVETGRIASPFYEAVRAHPDWRTTDGWDEFFFIEELDAWTVLFLSDHVDPDGRWQVTHGEVRGDEALYPHSAADYRRAIERATRPGKPVVIAGHNAFPGGNRPASIQRRFFPLPDAVRLHLYGHAHLGDEEWAGEHAYRTVSYVDDHAVPQVDVASLEDRRGDRVRSAVLRLYEGGELGVFVRDHDRALWEESYRSHAHRWSGPD